MVNIIKYNKIINKNILTFFIFFNKNNKEILNKIIISKNGLLTIYNKYNKIFNILYLFNIY